MHQFLNDLLNLPDTKVTTYKIVGNTSYIDVESTIDEVTIRKGYNDYLTIITSRLNDKAPVIVDRFHVAGNIDNALLIYTN